MPEKRGLFIVFDGIDGAGKTTQVELLADALTAAGLKVKTSKEPTDGEWGQKIRKSASTGRMPLDEELSAFIKDRQEHISTLIQPSLEKGEIVILDRYYYSTICYQGASGGDRKDLRDKVMSSAIKPDVTFIMDIDPYISQNRIEIRDGAPNEFEDLNFLINVRKNYDWLCDLDSDLYELDSNYPIETLHKTIIKLLIDNTFKELFCSKSYGCDDELHCSFALTETCQWAKIKNNLLKRLPKDNPYPSLISRNS